SSVRSTRRLSDGTTPRSRRTLTVVDGRTGIFRRDEDVTTTLSTAADVAARAVDVWKVFGSGEAQVIALHGVTVELERGQYTAIMGPSGSGKSTLMHCLAGLDSVTRGEVFIGGTRVT